MTLLDPSYSCGNHLAPVLPRGALLRKMGTGGKKHTLTSPGDFAMPTNLAVDGDGNLYVADTFNDRVEIFDADGNFIRTFGKAGDGRGYFARPKGIAIDRDGHIWVADAVQDRVQDFTPEGQVLLWMGGHGVLPGQFSSLAGLTIDKNNRVFTSEQYPGPVQMFRYFTDAEARVEKARRDAEEQKKPALGIVPQVLRQRIRRSLLIEALLKAAVQDKATVSRMQARAYYDRNSKLFQQGEQFSLQTISIVPPPNANAEIQKEARKRAEDALRQAKATKSYREFGLLAEKVSDDDWHVDMGDRKATDAAKLPPPLVQAARAMKPGQVSDLLQFGTNYTLFRLNGYTPAGTDGYQAVETKLRADLQKTKVNQLRTELNQRLQKNAKVEVL